MGFWSSIWGAIKNFIAQVGKLVTKIIKGLLNFVRDVVNWFKQFPLRKGKHTPFIVDADNPQFKEMLHKAPVKNVGLFEGVYNEETDEVEMGRIIEADQLDHETEEILGQEPIVVLN